MADQTAGVPESGAVSISIPSSADHVSLLRALVGFYAARQDFTLEEVDDLRMAVEEAAVQLLRRTTEDRLHLEVERRGDRLEARLHAAVGDDVPVMDDTSLSWMILSALADELRVTSEHGSAVVRMTKVRAASPSAAPAR